MRRDLGLMVLLVVGLLGSAIVRAASDSDLALVPAGVSVLVVAAIFVYQNRRGISGSEELDEDWVEEDGFDEFEAQFDDGLGIKPSDSYEMPYDQSYRGPSADSALENEYQASSGYDEPSAAFESWDKADETSGSWEPADESSTGWDEATSWEEADRDSSGLSTWSGSTGADDGLSTWSGSAGTDEGLSTWSGSTGADDGLSTWAGSTGTEEPSIEAWEEPSLEEEPLSPDATSEWGEPAAQPETAQWAEPAAEELQTWGSGGDLPTWQVDATSGDAGQYATEQSWDVSGDSGDFEPLPVWNTFAAEEVIEDVQSDEDILTASQQSALNVTEDLSEEEVQRVNQELLSRVHSLLAKYE